MRYIDEFQDNDHIIGHYLCKQKQNMKTRSGNSYLNLKLLDKTGVIDAKVWELTSDIQDFNEGEFVKVDADVLLYQNNLQMKVNKLRRSTEGEYDIKDYMPASDKDLDDLYKQLAIIIKSLTNPMIYQLMENILIRNDIIIELFKTHTAAKSLHHAYLGGLLEHTLSVAHICDFLSTRYKYVNRDLLVATAILHDIGKIYELSRLPLNDYTDDGQMLGHIVLGVEIINKAASKIPDFPHTLLSLIKHSIVAHHGELEFGSPRVPNTLEAFMLHMADNLDAKARAFEEAIEQDKTPGPWIGFNRMLNRYVRKSDIDKPPEIETENN